MHGKDITIPKGTEITAYIAADTPLSPANFNKAPSDLPTSAQTQSAISSESSELSSIAVKSTPDGADIKIDGRFVGSTPSTLRLQPGEHKIVLEKTGFKAWERTISVSSNANVVVDATLEKSP
jgi:hypothetical protein